MKGNDINRIIKKLIFLFSLFICLISLGNKIYKLYKLYNEFYFLLPDSYFIDKEKEYNELKIQEESSNIIQYKNAVNLAHEHGIGKNSYVFSSGKKSTYLFTIYSVSSQLESYLIASFIKHFFILIFIVVIIRLFLRYFDTIFVEGNNPSEEKK